MAPVKLQMVFILKKDFMEGFHLMGLSAGMLAKWPGPIHEGNVVSGLSLLTIRLL